MLKFVLISGLIASAVAVPQYPGMFGIGYPYWFAQQPYPISPNYFNAVNQDIGSRFGGGGFTGAPGYIGSSVGTGGFVGPSGTGGYSSTGNFGPGGGTVYTNRFGDGGYSTYQNIPGGTEVTRFGDGVSTRPGAGRYSGSSVGTGGSTSYTNRVGSPNTVQVSRFGDGGTGTYSHQSQSGRPGYVGVSSVSSSNSKNGVSNRFAQTTTNDNGDVRTYTQRS